MCCILYLSIWRHTLFDLVFISIYSTLHIFTRANTHIGVKERFGWAEGHYRLTDSFGQECCNILVFMCHISLSTILFPTFHLGSPSASCLTLYKPRFHLEKLVFHFINFGFLCSPSAAYSPASWPRLLTRWKSRSILALPWAARSRAS